MIYVRNHNGQILKYYGFLLFPDISLYFRPTFSSHPKYVRVYVSTANNQPKVYIVQYIVS